MMPLRLFLTVFGLTLAAASAPAPAAELSAVEQLYADLYKLDPAERAKRIEEGSKKEGGEISIVTGLGGSLGTGHLKIITDTYPFLKLKHTNSGSQDTVERIVAEETAGRHLTDFANTAAPDLAVPVEKNFLARYPTPMFNRMEPKFRVFMDDTKENRWASWAWTGHGISYNPDMIKEADAPKKWDDLCDPKYKGQVSFEPAETRFLIGIYLVMGEEKMQKWLQCIAKNDPIIMRGHTVRLNLMLAGDHAIQGDNFTYRGALLNKENPKKAPFKVVYTAEILSFADASIINRMTSKPYTAALLTDINYSDAVQQYMAKNFRSPVVGKDPFMPDDMILVAFNIIDDAVIKRLHGYWTATLGVRR
jgi:ABC-type Fe3+ transport system substrate-binding protein